MRPPFRRLACLLTLVVVAITAPRARADDAETERRLKAIGVPAQLRGEVRDAIDRGVDYLVGRQREDGRWVDPGDLVQAGVAHGDGLNALCSLALLHADTPSARRAAGRAVKALFPRPGAAASQLQDTVYGGGIGLQVLHAVEGDPRVIRHVAQRLWRGRDPSSGSWNYRTGTVGTLALQAPPGAPKGSGPLNLSTAQFAVLGLHAAAQTGLAMDTTVWRDVIDGLLRSQKSDGSWSYSHHHPGNPDTYPTGTFMGAANLVLARHHRARTTPERGSRARRLDRAVADARRALHADGRLALWLHRRRPEALDAYQLWSLEKACIFLDEERLDGVPWYAHLARTLVDAQHADGAWRSRAHARGPGGQPQDLVTSSFVLLVLVRDLETRRIATPRPIADPAVATPRGSDPVGDAPAPDPGAVPIDLAVRALGRLRAGLAAGDVGNGPLVDDLALVARALDGLAPPQGAAGELPDPVSLEEAILDVLLEALLVVGPDPDGAVDGRRAVNAAAARLLPTDDAARAARVRAILERRFAAAGSTTGWLFSRPYGPAFAWLARGGGPAVLAWMLEHAVSEDLDGERAERAAAMLDAVPGFEDLPGRARLAAARAVAARWIGSAGASAADHGVGGDHRRRRYWSRFRPRVMEALLALARDPATGAEPADDRGRTILALKPFRDWLRDHDDPRRPPWLDAR